MKRGKYWISVISHKRPDRVIKLSNLIGNATWYVGIGEESVYRASGAEFVVESGKLCPSRNRALTDAFKQGLICVELSDDLNKLELAEMVNDKKVAVPVSFDKVLDILNESLEASGFKLAGVAPTANPYFWHKDLTFNGFVVGDFIMVKPCELLFDENMTLKEDYDYTLNHINTFGGIVRNNKILASFAHRTNKGGAVAVRTPELEQKNIDYLKSKWHGKIRDNPRRPYEILLVKTNI